MANARKQPGLHGKFRIILALLLAVAASACTDWNSEGGTSPFVQTTGPAGYAYDGNGQGDGALLHWDTWQAPPADAVASADAATADTEPVYDWDALPADATADTADAAAADAPQVYSFDGKGDFVGWPDIPPPPDVELDAQDGADDATATDADDAGADAADAIEPADAITADDAWPTDSIEPGDAVVPADTVIPADSYQPSDPCPGSFACPCAQDTECQSGLCTNLGGGTLQCTKVCGSDGCPAGLECTQVFGASGDTLMVCMLPVLDAGPTDGGAGDADDASTTDVSIQDGLVDAIESDVWDNELPIDDSWQTDSSLPDVDPGDGFVSDGTGVPDSVDDSVQDQSTGEVTLLPDGAAAPDWQGYGDLSWPTDADIYAGAIGSCLSMYLYQNESCGDTHPSAACIDGIVADGSLYTQAMFDPLRQCEKAACVDLCASATDKTCMEKCIAKYCAPQFFACTSNAMIGTSTCADAWKCSQDYPGKFLTISAKCYAAANATGQQQFSAVISCATQPQTASCVPQIATCFGASPAGTENCGNTSACMNACNGDQSCSWSCLGKASPQAVQLVDDVWTCSVQQCQPKCAGAEPCQTDCLKSACQQQLVKCLTN